MEIWRLVLRHVLLVGSGATAFVVYAAVFAWLLGLPLGRTWLVAAAVIGGVLGFLMSAILSGHRSE